MAKNETTGNINAFIVRKGSQGLKTSKIEHKLSLRLVQNADIFLDNVFVPDNDRLEKMSSFRDTAKVRSVNIVDFPFYDLFFRSGAGDLSHYGGVAAGRREHGDLRHVPPLRQGAATIRQAPSGQSACPGLDLLIVPKRHNVEAGLMKCISGQTGAHAWGSPGSVHDGVARVPDVRVREHHRGAGGPREAVEHQDRPRDGRAGTRGARRKRHRYVVRRQQPH
jgi:hypothetical protein